MLRPKLARSNGMSNPTSRTALVIGVTGSFGGHAAQALIKHGWRIRALARDPQAAAQKAGPRTPIEWIQGDAMNLGDVVAAAEGCDVIVHAANPPAYRNWRGLVLPMTRATIAAATQVGARLAIPGNVYNYAPDAGPAITEDAPQAPVTRKGKIRVEMEEMLRLASADGVKVLIVRAGDYFGPAAPNSGLGWLTTRRGGRLTGVYAPAPPRSATPGPICPTWPRPPRGCSIAKPSSPTSRCFISRVSGSIAPTR